MKFSIRQILASCAGAVIAAVIASSFGVTGTIVGVAIGSVAATTGSALVAQSLDRGHRAVRQAVVRAPESSTLLRRLGGTRVSDHPTSSASSAPTQAVGRSASQDSGAAETGRMESAAAPVGETERLQISAETDAPATERLRASTAPARIARSAPGGRRFSWGAIAGTAAIVFVLALMFITAVELISGEPFASIFGGSGSGTTLQNLVNPAPASTTSTSSTTTSTSSTTTTTSASTTTSTTAPGSNPTTTTTPSPSTTTTTAGVGAASTTTTAASPP